MVLSPEQFFHGSYEKLNDGAILTPGANRGVQNFPPAGDNSRVFMADSALSAYDWGSLAAKNARRRNVHVYAVEPLGDVEDQGSHGFATPSARVVRKLSTDRRKN